MAASAHGGLLMPTGLPVRVKTMLLRRKDAAAMPYAAPSPIRLSIWCIAQMTSARACLVHHGIGRFPLRFASDAPDWRAQCAARRSQPSVQCDRCLFSPPFLHIRIMKLLRSLFAASLLVPLMAQAQFVTFRFTDGSTVIHPVTDILSTSFVDGAMRVALWDGTTYSWSMSSLSTTAYSDITTGAEEGAYGLSTISAFPNPSSGEVRVRFVMHAAGDATVDVTDLRGVLVRSVHRGNVGYGAQEFVWDGRDGSGQPVPAGSYLVRVVTGPRVASQQVILQ